MWQTINDQGKEDTPIEFETSDEEEDEAANAKHEAFLNRLRPNGGKKKEGASFNPPIPG